MSSGRPVGHGISPCRPSVSACNADRCPVWGEVGRLAAGRRGIGVLVVLVLLCGNGCAAARKGGPWAGMSQYDAGNAAHSIIGTETTRSDSPIYGKELAVVETKQGVLGDQRRPVWVASMEDFNNARSPYCIFLWGKFVPFQSETVKYDIAPCADSSSA